jgi:hypothetical protein
MTSLMVRISVAASEAFGRSTKSQAPNSKQAPMFKIRNLKQGSLGHWNLKFGIYLGFGI